MKRVAAYCRVSTENDDQLNSLDNQKTFFESYINKNLEWRFVNIYTDEGISGTNVNKRTGFKQMVQDAEAGKFDLLLTKEISRFARNTLDSIYYTRKLKALGIGVFFMNDNINTLDPDSELRLTIMASIAQEESRKTSDRVKWGHKRQMEKGVVFGNGVYGYDLHDGELTINEEQAKVVRFIFTYYLDEGMGSHLLCQELEKRGIPSPSCAREWKNATILQILKNEKYIGTLKQKKNVTVDFLSHKKKLNEGEEELIVIENHHEPIINRETFDKVQREIERRRTVTLDKSKHSNRYPWSGKIVCGLCGARYKRKIWHPNTPNQQIVWICSNNAKYGSEKINENGVRVGCNCKAIHESLLQETLLSALESVDANRNMIISEVKSAVRAAISEAGDHSQAIQAARQEIDRLENRKTKLIELYTDGAITRAQFDAANDQYLRQIETLLTELATNLKKEETVHNLEKKLATIDELIEELANACRFSESVCKQVLQKVVVSSRSQLTFYFNTGDAEPALFIPLSITPPLQHCLKGYFWKNIESNVEMIFMIGVNF